MEEGVSVTNTSGISSHDTDRLLQEAHRKKIMEHMALITFLSFMAVVGIIGNILTIIFYGSKVKMKKTSTLVLIKLLAVLDLIVCFLCFTTIADLFVNILFTNAILCKVMYFFDHWFVVSSVLTLWLISIDRYRRMCKPLGKQLTVKSATVAVIFLSTVSMVFSTHDFITYNPVKVNISTPDKDNPVVIGHYCTNTDEPSLETVVIVFHVLDALTIFTCLVTFVFTYGNIWRALREHNRKTTHLHTNPSSVSFRQSTSEFNSKMYQNEDDNLYEPTTITPLTRNPNVHFSLGSDINMETLNVSASIPSFKSTDTKLSTNNIAKANRPSKSSKTSRSERNLTLMMFAVTVGFVICFTPYFIVSAGIRMTSATTESELHTGIEFALRSPFWNSVINPIIFCVFNSQYRRYVKDVFTKCQVNEATINTDTS